MQSSVSSFSDDGRHSLFLPYSSFTGNFALCHTQLVCTKPFCPNEIATGGIQNELYSLVIVFGIQNTLVNSDRPRIKGVGFHLLYQASKCLKSELKLACPAITNKYILLGTQMHKASHTYTDSR